MGVAGGQGCQPMVISWKFRVVAASGASFEVGGEGALGASGRSRLLPHGSSQGWSCHTSRATASAAVSSPGSCGSYQSLPQVGHVRHVSSSMKSCCSSHLLSSSSSSSSSRCSCSSSPMSSSVAVLPLESKRKRQIWFAHCLLRHPIVVVRLHAARRSHRRPQIDYSLD